VIQSVGLGLSHSIIPPRGYHTRVSTAPAIARQVRPDFYAPWRTKCTSCMELVSKMPALISSKFSRSFLKGITLSLRCVHENETKTRHYHISLCRYLIQHIASNIDAPDGLRHARNCLETRRKAFRVLSHSNARYIDMSVQKQTLGKARLPFLLGVPHHERPCRAVFRRQRSIV